MGSRGSLAVGVGARLGTPAGEILRLIASALASAGLDRADIAVLATVDTKTGEPGLRAAARELGVPLVGHPAAALAAVAVPNPSARARAAVGTPSVAEAAALVESGGGDLLVPKLGSPTATVAVARRAPGGDHPREAPAPPAALPADQAAAPGGRVDALTAPRQGGGSAWPPQT